MKKIIFAFLFVFLAKITIAQQSLLSFDEHNKYIYYQVADAPGHSADSLHIKVAAFLKAEYPKLKYKAATDSKNINAAGKFLIYGGVSVLKHEKGEINYELNIEFKDQKYRYWITGFIFTPYQRDRYGNFVPEQGIEVPLENLESKFEKKDADAYLDEAGAFCKQFGDHLKQFILNAPKKEEIVKKIVTDQW